MRADKARIQKAFLPPSLCRADKGEGGEKRDVQYDSPFMLVARWKYLVACIYTGARFIYAPWNRFPLQNALFFDNAYRLRYTFQPV